MLIHRVTHIMYKSSVQLQLRTTKVKIFKQIQRVELLKSLNTLKIHCILCSEKKTYQEQKRCWFDRSVFRFVINTVKRK